ncbi:hypothetical protein PPYR_03890 [Photinus pyralis]|uniref:Cadherin domain-containing protein n=1 Tax=Photinus pyralis TaxID=7054 RepID=A0A5N4AWJ8_PHOPY|nr:hypothetical protein PPYR_03890 [Photinus pyralis]
MHNLNSPTWIVLGLVTLFCKAYATNHPPILTSEINSLVISENTALDTVVVKLEGHDPENSTVKFGLYGTDLLNVDSSTGEIKVVKPLDREINDTLHFFVTIEDEVKDAPVGGNNIVTVPVTAIILDENDHPPLFQNVPYFVYVNESTPVGTVIFSDVLATDVDTVGDAIEMECLDHPDFTNACHTFSIVTIESTQNIYRGAIKLKKELDYTVKSEYKILLKAMDGELNTTVEVEIHVLDIQNTPPAFIGLANAEIFEDAPINTLVFTLHAEDGDRGAPRSIIYELVNNPMDYFLIDANSGQVRTARPLDKEAIDNPLGLLSLEVKAIEVTNGIPSNDSLSFTTAIVNVTVNDVNDEPPSFNKKEYFVEVPEDIRNGDVLPNLNMLVSDPDVANNSVFELQLDDISHSFKILPEIIFGSSEVTIQVVNSSLDYEDVNQRKFIVLVIAREIYTDPKLSSTATITITVTDANDNSPTFEQKSYSAIVSEVASSGTVVTTILAKDRDSSKFGDLGIIYTLSGLGSERFEVNNRTGVITVAECSEPGAVGCLDYETKPEYILYYNATDNEGKGHTTQVPLKIVLIDSNDNAPMFNSSLYNISISEGAAKFDPDLVVEAKDIDKTSHVTYSIIAGNENGLFNIDSNSGKIRIASNQVITFSNDVTENNIPLTIEATDGKFTSITVVNINVNDINDHAPMFEQGSYNISVPEDIYIGTSVVQLHATDEDAGTNAEISYYLKKGALTDFTIENETGVIRVANKLDYDRQHIYHIEIVAADGGVVSLSSTNNLTIHIINVNDKSPYFVPTNQKAEIMKDAKLGTVVHSLSAFDPDISSPDALNYEIIEPIVGTNKYGEPAANESYRYFFSVDKSTGNVSVQSILNRDVAATVQLTVRVTDVTAANPQHGEGILSINIIDINDHPPIFLPPWTKEMPQYNLQLEEELPVGTIVGTFTAVDDDSPIAGYSIEPNMYFEINNGTGIVQLQKMIDYEMITKLNFTIYAYDSGIPQLNTSAFIDITVLNINDNSPIFSETSYNATVDENSPNGTYIVTVHADDSDADEYGVVSYSLLGEHSENFEISSHSGEISVKNPLFLDHEMLNETVIQVMASDGGVGNLRRTKSVPVYIAVADINDNAPEFNQSIYNTTVSENVRFNPPFKITQVFATDDDAGINGNVIYTIHSGNDDDIFLLGEDTGILYVHKSLAGRTGTFSLLVEARDGGNQPLTDTCIVNIKVVNVNDHKPNFIHPMSTRSVIEITDTPIADYLVMTVKAADKDNGENGRVTYHFKLNDENVQMTDEFIINPDTGDLRIKTYLDNKIQDKYELTLVARDHGESVWHETLHYLTVLVMNSDNEATYIDYETNTYHFSITENSPPNTFVGRLKLMSRNQDKTSKVYYYLLSDIDNAFYIDKLNGSLYTRKGLDREHIDEYELQILANSEPDFYLTSMEENHMLNESDTLRNVATVKVTILDVNDNGPVFNRTVYYAAVNCIADINTFVANVSAIDLDFGVNGSFMYYIKSSNLYKYDSIHSSGSVIPSPFVISESGQIFTATNLSENNQHHFIVNVVAKEIMYPERESDAKVYVWIFEPEQLIRIILSRPVEEVLKEKDEIVQELTNATNSIIIATSIKSHINETGQVNDEWSDLYILSVNRSTQTIDSVFDILKIIDAKYDFLKDYYAGFAIENVLPAFAQEEEESFDPALSALIALVVVLTVGIVTFTVVCCCLRKCMISPNDLKKKKDALISKAIIDELNTTENPLWIEQKLKIYEEQELTMQVFNEPDQAAMERRNSSDYVLDDNTYATIQHPNRRGSAHTATLSLGDDIADYATLSRIPRHSTSSQGSLKDTVNYYEAAMGFQGSTFQVPDSSLGDIESEECRSHRHDSQMSVNNEGQLEYVAELI